MSAPNLATVSTITAKSVTADLTTIGANIVSNAADSGKLFKINNVVVSNIDGGSAATVTLRVSKSLTARDIYKGISVPVGSSLVLVDRNTAMYLEENDLIYMSASADNDLTVMINYEEIS
mgnify:CR=1 FL=1